jgi:hypothetical protein
MSTIVIGGMEREVRWRQQLQPDLAVLAEDSGCIVLECGLGEPKTYVTLSDVDRLAEAVKLARVHVRAAEEDEWSRRRADMAELDRQRWECEREQRRAAR